MNKENSMQTNDSSNQVKSDEFRVGDVVCVVSCWVCGAMLLVG